MCGSIFSASKKLRQQLLSQLLRRLLRALPALLPPLKAWEGVCAGTNGSHVRSDVSLRAKRAVRAEVWLTSALLTEAYQAALRPEGSLEAKESRMEDLRLGWLLPAALQRPSWKQAPPVGAG